MQISLPWILSRKRLIAAVIADGALFAFLYCTLLVALWCCRLSRRIGSTIWFSELCHWALHQRRQKFSETETWDFVGKQLIGTGTVLLLTLGITLLHIWLFNQNSAQASFRSFLIPL